MTTDLRTLNTANDAIRRALRHKVCDYEQKAIDASRQGDYLGAKTYKDWAFAIDLALSAASLAITELFLEASRASLSTPNLRLVSHTEFPSLERSEQDRQLDEHQREVVSAQPEPEPA